MKSGDKQQVNQLTLEPGRRQMWPALCTAVTTLLCIGSIASAAPSQKTTSAQAQNQFGNVETLKQLLSRTVVSSDNQQIGKLDNIVMDLESGRVLYAVVDMKDGDRMVALPPGVFERSKTKNLRLKVDQQKLSGAPEFTANMRDAGQMGQASFVSKVYQHFGQGLWWQGNTAADQGAFNNVHDAKQLPGVDVVNVQNAEVGEVRTAAVDLAAGRVLFVIITPSDKLNLGNNLFALPPDALTLGSDKDHLVSSVTREKLASAPRFQTGKAWPIENRQFATQVYQYYGKQPYFQSQGNLQPTGRDPQQVYPQNRNQEKPAAWESGSDDQEEDYDPDWENQ
ncbi:MAG TPA: PRC-barrel domain-containing protein [Clostridia bacterium]|nr:PRC-barrel domain-containing protein [Clostridia bacterium]